MRREKKTLCTRKLHFVAFGCCCRCCWLLFYPFLLYFSFRFSVVFFLFIPFYWNIIDSFWLGDLRFIIIISSFFSSFSRHNFSFVRFFSCKIPFFRRSDADAVVAAVAVVLNIRSIIIVINIVNRYVGIHCCTVIIYRIEYDPYGYCCAARTMKRKSVVVPKTIDVYSPVCVSMYRVSIGWMY